ncbi:hypothetical protein DL96DRAFT_1576942 [Flagelloscypha sp. PMI_526]|nr:hypothetical protein DL96DRAFT_1576942 [Flagelloscypha sp. PMI_526]
MLSSGFWRRPRDFNDPLDISTLHPSGDLFDGLFTVTDNSPREHPAPESGDYLFSAFDDEADIPSLLDSGREVSVDCLDSSNATIITLLEPKSMLNLFPPIPLDIVCIIVCISASEDGIAQARDLSLVSRQVQEWVDGILFSNFKWDIPTESNLHPQFLNHSGSILGNLPFFLGSPRFSRIRHHVKELHVIDVEEKTDLASDILIEFPNLTSLILSMKASMRITKNMIDGTATADAPLYSPLGITNIQWLATRTKVVPLSSMGNRVIHLSLHLLESSSLSLWDIKLPVLQVLIVRSSVSGNTNPINFAQVHLAKARAPQLELVLWYDTRTEIILPSSWKWEIAARAIRHPKLIFVIASPEEEIPAARLWPFLPLPLGYTNPFESRCLNHLRLEERGRELVKKRAESLSSALPF